MRLQKKSSAFTLIELLIVVAIIAILAAIAVPNFLEAQVRAKVSRCKADMRTLATAIETYTVDYNRGPLGLYDCIQGNVCGLAVRWKVEETNAVFGQLTTPVAYITAVPIDVFRDKRGRINSTTGAQEPNNTTFEYNYNRAFPPCNQTNAANLSARANGHVWQMFSQGPFHAAAGPWPWAMLAYPLAGGQPPNSIYDPTNGSVSKGFIIRTSKGMFTGPNS